MHTRILASRWSWKSEIITLGRMIWRTQICVQRQSLSKAKQDHIQCSYSKRILGVPHLTLVQSIVQLGIQLHFFMVRNRINPKFKTNASKLRIGVHLKIRIIKHWYPAAKSVDTCEPACDAQMGLLPWGSYQKKCVCYSSEHLDLS